MVLTKVSPILSRKMIYFIESSCRILEKSFFQIVAPRNLRRGIISLANDTPLAENLGNKKTRERVMQNFFWPGMYIDISRYCKSCSTYQKGTANGITPKARLVRIPPIDDPFSSVAIDFVGPLPMTEKRTGTFWYVWVMQRDTQKRFQ